MKNLLKIMLIALMFTALGFSQQGLVGPIAVQSGYGFLHDGAVTSANDTLFSNWVNIGTYNTVALGFATNDSAKIAITVYYTSDGSNSATMAVAAGDTLTTASNTGAYLPLTIRGYNSSGTFVNRIPAATKIKVRVVRLAGSGVTFSLTSRVVFKN